MNIQKVVSKAVDANDPDRSISRKADQRKPCNSGYLPIDGRANGD